MMLLSWMWAKDVSAGVSSPPQAFVDEQFLTNTRLLLKDSGKYTTCIVGCTCTHVQVQ